MSNAFRGAGPAQVGNGARCRGLGVGPVGSSDLLGRSDAVASGSEVCGGTVQVEVTGQADGAGVHWNVSGSLAAVAPNDPSVGTSSAAGCALSVPRAPAIAESLVASAGAALLPVPAFGARGMASAPTWPAVVVGAAAARVAPVAVVGAGVSPVPVVGAGVSPVPVVGLCASSVAVVEDSGLAGTCVAPVSAVVEAAGALFEPVAGVAGARFAPVAVVRAAAVSEAAAEVTSAVAEPARDVSSVAPEAVVSGLAFDLRPRRGLIVSGASGVPWSAVPALLASVLVPDPVPVSVEAVAAG
ncbi:hypothetical protein JNW90_09645, partial [Micromonospora sp. STR1s_5]|nr:hypothetical protein [Micromonospora sp. STR1s_5]